MSSKRFPHQLRSSQPKSHTFGTLPHYDGLYSPGYAINQAHVFSSFNEESIIEKQFRHAIPRHKRRHRSPSKHSRRIIALSIPDSMHSSLRLLIPTARIAFAVRRGQSFTLSAGFGSGSAKLSVKITKANPIPSSAFLKRTRHSSALYINVSDAVYCWNPDSRYTQPIHLRRLRAVFRYSPGMRFGALPGFYSIPFRKPDIRRLDSQLPAICTGSSGDRPDVSGCNYRQYR